nr:MFS transporter [Gimesia benthica]
MVMPLIFGLFVGILGFSDSIGWRASMFLAGLVCALTGIAYYFLTQDAPDGNFKELREAGKMPQKAQQRGQFLNVCKDHRVWALFVIYGACFGIELTINNVAALYFLDYFDYFKSMDTTKAVKMAGLFAGLFGLMNIFARTLGGIFGDRFGQKWGLSGRVKWLFIAVFCEGIALMIFSQMSVLAMALPSLIVFSLFVQMSEGATYSVVPFINKKALGAVSGIVGAGGNAGAVTAGFLFKTQAINWPTALFILGAIVTCCAFLTFLVRFSEEMEEEARLAHESALAPQPGEQELAPSMGQ